ncbi:MAG: hypothetical protein IT381_02165 [Deltaproteobacteria bacterium]|nr:hypothetical protein [Deltaproteobacteria bacterium]
MTRALALNPELAKTTSTEAALAALSQQRALPAQAKAPARPRLLDARPPATPETRDFVARVGASKRDHAAAKLGFAKAAAALDAEARALAIERQAQADAALAAVVDLLRRVDPTLASPKTKVVLEADARFLASIGFRPELAGRKKERDDHGERHQ